MKKLLLGFLAVVFFIAIALVLGRNIVARAVVIGGIKQACGVKIAIAKVDIGLPKVTVLGLKVYNPPGFEDKLLADIPEISVEFDLPAFFKNKVHIGKLKLDVRELGLILNEQGKLNVNSFALVKPKQGGGKPPEVKIDELSIKIGKVSYKGRFPVAGVKTFEFNPKVDDTFHDVTNPSEVAGEILEKILSRIGIGSFADFTANGGMGQAAQEIGGTIEKTMKNATQGLEGLFNTK